MKPSLNIKNYIPLGFGLVLMILALALASRTPLEPTPQPDSALVFATALHYTPSPPRIETVLVTVPAITQILVTPTPTPTSIFRVVRSNLDLTIDQVFADPGVPWKLVSCCRQAALTPVYDPALNRWCVLVSGSGVQVSDGTQVRLAAFAAVLVPNQDVPGQDALGQEQYQMSAAIFGFGNNDPRVSTTVDRQGKILVRLQGFNVYDLAQSSEHTIALSPVSSSNHSRVIILTGRANEVIPDTMEY